MSKCFPPIEELLLDENDLNDDGEGGSRPYLSTAKGLQTNSYKPLKSNRKHMKTIENPIKSHYQKTSCLVLGFFFSPFSPQTLGESPIPWSKVHLWPGSQRRPPLLRLCPGFRGQRQLSHQFQSRNAWPG